MLERHKYQVKHILSDGSVLTRRIRKAKDIFNIISRMFKGNNYNLLLDKITFDNDQESCTIHFQNGIKTYIYRIFN